MVTNNFKTSYLERSLKISKSQQKEYTMSESLQIYVKDKLPSGLDMENILDRVSSLVPSHLMSEVDSIFIGMFDEFEEMDTNAMFKDGAIYVTNDQDNEEDLVDDIIHEFAHSLENSHGFMIYGDGKLEQEFLTKRERLYEVLKSEGLTPDPNLFLNPDYTKELDMYLYEEVGYDKLNFIVASYGLFTSAYSATALREYYANGFEYFFLDDRKYLKEINPVLYTKIEELYEI